VDHTIKKSIESIKGIQKVAVRFISNIQEWKSVTEARNLHKLTLLESRRQNHLMTLLHKILKMKLPTILHLLFMLRS